MGQGQEPAQDLPFIVLLDSAKPNDETRKVIRSHVMKGKNKGRTRNSRGLDHSSSRRTNKSLAKVPQVSFSPDCLARRASIPHRVGTDITLGFEPADVIDVSLILPVFKFSSMAKQVMFSLEPHVLFNDASGSQYRDYLALDAAYLNAVVYAVHLYFDLAAGLGLESIQPSRPAYKHLSKCLTLIRERLANEDVQARLSDATVMAIMILASYSSTSGQYETAASHLHGVRKIVDLRGGLIKFRTNPKLLIEMFRCDLGLALSTGAPPVFFYDAVVEPFMPYLNGLSSFIPPSFRVLSPPSMTSKEMKIADPELARAWDTISTFCALLNFASEAGRKVPKETLLNAMASVMYRVLRLSFTSGTLEEMLRLGILSFCSHIFLQWPQIKASYTHLSAMYRSCLADLSVNIPEQTLLWLLSCGYIFLSREDTGWLQPLLRTSFNVCLINSWSEARTILKAHLWVDFIHDRFGLRMFDKVSQLPVGP